MTDALVAVCMILLGAIVIVYLLNISSLEERQRLVDEKTNIIHEANRQLMKCKGCLADELYRGGVKINLSQFCCPCGVD